MYSTVICVCVLLCVAKGYVTGLQELYARRVGLVGELPAELGELRQLRVLSMGNNRICGSLPPSLGRLTNLQRIVLHQNKLSGKLLCEVMVYAGIYMLYCWYLRIFISLTGCLM